MIQFCADIRHGLYTGLSKTFNNALGKLHNMQFLPSKGSTFTARRHLAGDLRPNALRSFSLYFVLLCLLTTFNSAVVAADLRDVRVWNSPERTRVVFDLSEGVEHKHQEDFLLEAGCQISQGFLYSKPMALQDVLRESFAIPS